MKRPEPKFKPKTVKNQVKSVSKDPVLNSTDYLWLFGLLILSFIVYFPTLSKIFIDYDDSLYILDCPDIRYFTLSKIPSIFSHFYMAQYSPIPTIVCGIIHMAGGFKPSLFNIIGLLLHLVNIALVFTFIWKLTKKFPMAFIVAALFGLSPMQVESVAWSAAVFKTGLYTMFYLSSLLLYIKYVKSNNILYLILSLLLFFGSFFSKEQSVALSLSVIAIDYFLGRNLFSKKVILEKIPYLLISLIIGITALASTKTYHETLATTPFTFFERFLYASYALANYVVKLLVPFKLTIYHPYLKIRGVIFYLCPLLFLVILGVFYYFWKKKNSYVIFGMLFFFINIGFSLSLQFVAARSTMMADRYVYMASIGYYFILGSIVVKLMDRKKLPQSVIVSVMAVYIGIMSIYSYNRTFVYKNTGAVMSDVIDKYPQTSFPYVNRGIYLRQNGQEELAFQDYNMAIKLDPKDDNAFLNRGNIYFYRNKDTLALADYNKSLAINPYPKGAEIFSNRGAIYARMNQFDKSLDDYVMALKKDPYFITTYLNRAVTYSTMKKYDLAIQDFDTYLKYNTGNVGVYNDRGVMKQNLNRHEDAIKDFTMAIQMKPDEALYYINRSLSHFRLGDKTNALNDAQTSARLGNKVDPNYITAINNLK
jgi:protein O-mannosyl-transferase